LEKDHIKGKGDKSYRGQEVRTLEEEYRTIGRDKS